MDYRRKTVPEKTVSEEKDESDTFFGLKRFRLLSDDDGHKYLIEVGKEEAFRKWIEAGPYWENYAGEEFESLGSHFSTYSFADPRQI